jgi:hypothetical protein
MAHRSHGRCFRGALGLGCGGGVSVTMKYPERGGDKVIGTVSEPPRIGDQLGRRAPHQLAGCAADLSTESPGVP